MILLITHAAPDKVILGYRKTRADNILRRVNAFMYNLYIKLLFGLN